MYKKSQREFLRPCGRCQLLKKKRKQKAASFLHPAAIIVSFAMHFYKGQGFVRRVEEQLSL